jgi:ethanolamine permease
MITVLALRKKEPQLERPFKVPFYPAFPVIALVIASVSLVAMATLNIKLSVIYFSILALAYIWFHFFVNKRDDAKQALSS